MRDFALARLIVAGDRSARRRLLGIVAGVMVGVAEVEIGRASCRERV